MGIVGVPVIDGDPVQIRAEVLFHLRHEVPGEPLQVGHVGGILRRDDEAEMVPVVLAVLGEGGIVGIIAAGVGHQPAAVVAADALALEIGEMGRHRRRAEGPAPVPDHPRLHHHPALRREQTRAAKARPSAPKGRVAGADGSPRGRRFPGRSRLSDRPGLPRRAQHLIDEAAAAGRRGRARPARADAELAVVMAHDNPPCPAIRATVPKSALKSRRSPQKAAWPPTDWPRKRPAMSIA
ncbi:hypothetical protein ATH84_103630 [Paracoccus versutus]|uniref:Uncharacterized protein n=1 Tax=Paracoccus versutus TaxID=34007 RepID=A0AAQ0HEE5_PARVE|nr:hypothetical protein ATH84_103630 [Paracoccus versutus]